VLREIARGGLAGLIAGIVVGGLGGRLVMMLAARLNPDATGRLTENGEVVGAFTVNGTIALLLFGGVFAGVAAGVTWVVISPWVPLSGWRRWLLAAPLGISLGAFLLIHASNRDFQILNLDAVIVALLLALVGLVAVAVAWLDEKLDRRLPRADRRPIAGLVAYGVIAGIGLLFVPVVLGLYFTSDGCGCGSPPVIVGWFLVAVGLVTVAWWAMRIARGRPDRPRLLVVAGRVGVTGAAFLGAAYLVPILVTILGAA
jgi:MFS family permease